MLKLIEIDEDSLQSPRSSLGETHTRKASGLGLKTGGMAGRAGQAAGAATAGIRALCRVTGLVLVNPRHRALGFLLASPCMQFPLSFKTSVRRKAAFTRGITSAIRSTAIKMCSVHRPRDRAAALGAVQSVLVSESQGVARVCSLEK